MFVPSSELAPPVPSPANECVPPGTKHGGQHSLMGEGAGVANSDEGTDPLVLCGEMGISDCGVNRGMISTDHIYPNVPHTQ